VAARDTSAPDEHSAIEPVGCKNCQLLPPPHAATGTAPGDAGCGCGAYGCVPGRLKTGSLCEADTYCGRLLCGLYECICCPDPCYDPHWIPLADAAFFVEGVRPQSQQRLRWDAGRDMIFPDAAEFFWARADGQGKGPRVGGSAAAVGGAALPGVPAVPGVGGGAVVAGAVRGETRVNYDELSLYTEGATGGLGMFVEIPYLAFDGDQVNHGAGFSDMNVGTRTLLFDCELLQLGFVFRTFIPIGNFTRGIGTGHVSLEPSLVLGLKLAPDTYFQGQLAEWVPIGGDPDYAGSILHYHFSVNQVLCRLMPDVPLIGTLELNGWSFQHGEFTDPFLGPQKVGGLTYVSMGPGLRLFVCDKIDVGLGTAFAVTQHHFAEQLYRTEFRVRF
jgi:hypothetical protein